MNTITVLNPQLAVDLEVCELERQVRYLAGELGRMRRRVAFAYGLAIVCWAFVLVANWGAVCRFVAVLAGTVGRVAGGSL